MKAYARYIKTLAKTLQIHPYQTIYIAYNRILPHNRLSNSKTCQTHEIILIKPMFLSQKDSKPQFGEGVQCIILHLKDVSNEEQGKETSGIEGLSITHLNSSGFLHLGSY